MGQSRMWTYSLKFRCVSGKHYTPNEWRVKSHRLYGPGFGKPTPENIDKWVSGFEQSMIDGVNKHLGTDQVVYAEIVDQRTGEVVAKWKRSEFRKDQPLFQVI